MYISQEPQSRNVLYLNKCVTVKEVGGISAAIVKQVFKGLVFPS
jgi:hypothetical protein